MADNKRGLGRGLSALLGEGAETEPAAAPAVAAGAQEIPIELIRRNPDQPRRVFDETEIEELAESIKEKGLLQPILVRPVADAPGEYQIVAGERRWRAAQRAGLREAPVVVRELDDAETLELAILENVQRSDLNALEEARGYRALMEAFSRTQDQVASAVGKSRSHIANTLRLMTLPSSVQDMLMAGHLSAGHARTLVGHDDAAKLAQRIVDEGLNVRQTEALVKGEPLNSGGGGSSKSGSGASKDIDTLDLERRVAEILGLTVDIRDKNGKGEIRVKYQTLEQLEDVCKRLAPGS